MSLDVDPDLGSDVHAWKTISCVNQSIGIKKDISLVLSNECRGFRLFSTISSSILSIWCAIVVPVIGVPVTGIWNTVIIIILVKIIRDPIVIMVIGEIIVFIRNAVFIPIPPLFHGICGIPSHDGGVGDRDDGSSHDGSFRLHHEGEL